jgi:hypothetical protein
VSRVRCQPRLPTSPLEAWLNARYTNTSPSADEQLGGRLSARRIAVLVGYTDNPDAGRSIVQHWRGAGIPLYAADRAAIRAGTHPVAIWPQFHHLADEDTMSVTFHIDHRTRAELDALEIEGAPTLNVNNANAGHLQALLGLTPGPYGEIAGAELLARITAVGSVDQPPIARRLRALADVATAAVRLGRDVAWD